MKKNGNTCDYTPAKNSELLRKFNALIRAARIIDLDEIFAQVAVSEASRFYISEERAYELIVHRLKTGAWSISKKLRVEMLEEILRRTKCNQ